ncbi:MAG: hypothetical protein E5V66_11070 [Mesorhizobium sp.]|uniref:hypothetical protein n=1 Tax=Mesorhizobium sp. TaxID=1871066 RepID=UPI001200F3EB|nr:hypothetical protein [Mesorhizobium sp.]TIW11983.1 MAG: hypothetical protein E5V66_11070 [Mesorhizobium sp.]
MQVINPFRSGLLSDCKKGDLLALNYGQRPAYAVMVNLISPQGDELAVLAVLRPTEQDLPYLAVINSQNDCVNLGSEWIFEVELPDAAGKGFDEDGSKPGIITIAGNEPTIRLGRDPNDIQSRASHLNLVKLEAGAAPRGYAVSVGRWAVWLNAEHRARIGAEPLFRWPPAAVTA